MIPLRIVHYDVDQLFEPEILFRAIKPKTLLIWACYYVLRSIKSKTEYNIQLPTYLYNAICFKFILQLNISSHAVTVLLMLNSIVLRNVAGGETKLIRNK